MKIRRERHDSHWPDRGDSVKIKLRVASQQRDLIDRAARIMGKTRTEFMLEAAYRAAEEIVSPDVA
jgi:uncharacterized protein (DUF1778 family)